MTEQAEPKDQQEALERDTRARWESLRPYFDQWAAENGEPESTFDEYVESRVETARADYQKGRASEELEAFAVQWDRLSANDASHLQDLLDENANENELHQFLDHDPRFLIQVLTGGHGRYQISKQRLGAEFVPDFMVCQNSSIGVEWFAVEIESPLALADRKNGEPRQELNHAISQIREWRAWLMHNIDYARRPKEQDGLGLVGIDARVPGLILIGRRHPYQEKFNEFRRQMTDRENIVIHSYDWLVDVARSNRSAWLTSELPRH